MKMFTFSVAAQEIARVYPDGKVWIKESPTVQELAEAFHAAAKEITRLEVEVQRLTPTVPK